MNRRSFVTALTAAASTLGLKGKYGTTISPHALVRGSQLASSPPSPFGCGLGGETNSGALSLEEATKMRAEYSRRQATQPHRLAQRRRDWRFSGFDPDLHALRSFSTSARITIQRERELASASETEGRYWQDRLLDHVFDKENADLLKGFF